MVTGHISLSRLNLWLLYIYWLRHASDCTTSALTTKLSILCLKLHATGITLHGRDVHYQFQNVKLLKLSKHWFFVPGKKCDSNGQLIQLSAHHGGLAASDQRGSVDGLCQQCSPWEPAPTPPPSTTPTPTPFLLAPAAWLRWRVGESAACVSGSSTAGHVQPTPRFPSAASGLRSVTVATKCLNLHSLLSHSVTLGFAHTVYGTSRLRTQLMCIAVSV